MQISIVKLKKEIIDLVLFYEKQLESIETQIYLSDDVSQFEDKLNRLHFLLDNSREFLNSINLEDNINKVLINDLKESIDIHE